MSSGKTKIPETVADLMLELSGEVHPATQKRWTSAQLAAWLKTEHGITVDPRTVSNLLHTLRTQAALALQDGVRHVILDRLAPQLNALDDLTDALAADASQSTKLSERVTALEAVRRVIETKLKFSGVGERVTMDTDASEGGSMTATTKALHDRIGAIASRARRASAGDTG